MQTHLQLIKEEFRIRATNSAAPQNPQTATPQIPRVVTSVIFLGPFSLKTLNGGRIKEF